MRGIPRARKLHALVAKIESRRFVTAAKGQTATDVTGMCWINSTNVVEFSYLYEHELQLFILFYFNGFQNLNFNAM
jgi:hypothetical protein